MRIIGGTASGRRLVTPKHSRIRPTADRVKEALFNILAVLLGSLDGSRVLDIFAGTGNLGIEALSRGAATVLFIDDSRDAVALVKKNLELAGFPERGTILHKEAIAALKGLAKSAGPFDLIFLDPPYGQGLSCQVLELLADSPLTDDDTLVIVETAAREKLPSRFGRLREFDRRSYGDSSVTFYAAANESRTMMPD